MTDSQPVSHDWRRHRNHLYSVHNSGQLCCPDSRTLLDKWRAVSNWPSKSKKGQVTVTCYLYRVYRCRCDRYSCRAHRR